MVLVGVPIQNPEQRRDYMRVYNAQNRETLTAKKAERRRQQRDFINAVKSVPCKDCGVAYPPWVMEFDHVRGQKLCNLSVLARKTVSWETIKTEIAKCEVVCANCHRQRTHDRESLRMGLR